jgi:hypothetical protein
LFTIKGNLVFMNNLYHKVAVASICTALGFALGASKEAKAATFTLARTSSFVVVDSNRDGLGDYSVTSFGNLPVGILGSEEARAFYEFNIANLFLASNTVISQAIFQASVNTILGNDLSFQVDLFGYTANRRPFIRESFGTGVYLDSDQPRQPAQVLSFDVASLINQNIRNNDIFAGFGIRTNGGGNVIINQDASLIITTVDVAEPVPEPTTILGSALALSLGGWLKRKKSSQQNKTKL